jgi:hypothetical protein
VSCGVKCLQNVRGKVSCFTCKHEPDFRLSSALKKNVRTVTEYEIQPTYTLLIYMEVKINKSLSDVKLTCKMHEKRKSCTPPTKKFKMAGGVMWLNSSLYNDISRIE